MNEIHCAYCGKNFPPTPKDRPRQHKNGAKTCIGSGQQRPVHDFLNKTKATAAQRTKHAT